jgi:hypothetical protein
MYISFKSAGRVPLALPVLWRRHAVTRACIAAIFAGVFFFACSLPGKTAVASGGQLRLTVTDEKTGELLPCRLHLKNPAGRSRPIKGGAYFHDHVAFAGDITLKLPKGQYTFEIERGPEYTTQSGYFVIEDHADDTKTVTLKRAVEMAAKGWWSSDLNVQRPLRDLELLMQADDLHVAAVIDWKLGTKKSAASKNAGSSFKTGTGSTSGATASSSSSAVSSVALLGKPAVAPKRGFETASHITALNAAASTDAVSLGGGRFYIPLVGEDRRQGNDTLYLNLPRPAELSGDGDGLSPLELLRRARTNEKTWIDVAHPFSWDLPVALALGCVDSIELCNDYQGRETTRPNEGDGRRRNTTQLRAPWGNGLWSQQIYYHVINTGLAIPPSAGSGTGDAPNPIGYNRMYVYAGRELEPAAWWEAFRAGQVIVTNGPVIRLDVNGKPPGHVFTSPAGEPVRLEVFLTLSTRDPISYLEIVKNGQLDKALRIEDWAKEGRLPEVVFASSGWFLIRAVTDVEKTYRFASSAPYYVSIGEQPKRISRASVQFFVDWLAERRAVLERGDKTGSKLSDADAALFDEAERFWNEQLTKANAP